MVLYVHSELPIQRILECVLKKRNANHITVTVFALFIGLLESIRITAMLVISDTVVILFQGHC